MTAARLLMAAGAVALLGVAVVHVDGALGERRARAELAFASPAPDTREWSKTRRAAWEASRSTPAGTPLGLLSIPSLGLSVVVFEGTDALSLNRGVGRIQGTRIQSNLGIAGHRDGFFRSLRKVTKGDRITLETRGSTYAYEVRSLSIVSPEDVQVLDPTPGPTLTLVTCHPFFVLGHAPQRFIVHAVRVPESAGVSSNASLNGLSRS